MLRDHLRPGRQPGAARAGPRAAGRGRAGARRPRRGADPAQRAARPCSSTATRPSGPVATTACATRWPPSTPPPSPPPTSSASSCCARSGVAGDTDAGRRPWSRPSTSSWSRWSTTSTCAASATSAERPAVRPRDRPAPGPQGGRRPAGRAGPGRAGRGDGRRGPGRASPGRCAPRSSGASAGSGSSATTTCSAGSPRALEPTDAPARDRMRGRWRIVLVDEFQDTDPVQWQVLDRAFAGHATMVLIGDPKQAIYAFRGGDVVTYLAAARTADRRRPRWPRTGAATPPWSTGSRSCCGGAALGDPEIVVRDGRRPPPGQPARRRPVATRRSGSGWSRRDGFRLVADAASIPMAAVRDHIARDCAADIAGLLASGATCDERPVVAGRRRGARRGPRPRAAGAGALADARHPGGRGRRWPRLPDAGRRRVAGAARGARAAAPLRPGPGGRA